MCSLDLEPCDVWSERAFTARKSAGCDGCGAMIHPGDPYVRHFHVFQDEPGSQRICSACWFAREEFAEAHGQNFWPSMLADQLRDCIQDDIKEDARPWRDSLAALLRRNRHAVRAEASP